MDVRATCVAKLSGLDEDVLEYVIGMLEGDESDDDKSEALSSFLISCEHCATEEQATATCSELMAALKPPSVDVSDAAEEASAAPLKLLSAPTSLADSDAKLFGEDESGLGGRLVAIDEAVDTRKKRKAAAEAERRATKAQYMRIQAQRAEEEQALQAAAQQAVTLRRQVGAYTGSVEARPFSLPNPGGGTDLLENASFTLMRGRIYGLIGRNGKGKSTLLRAIASRAVGDIPPELTVHYVSQEVQLDGEKSEWTPTQYVVHADIERRLLLEEFAALTSEGTAADGEAAGGAASDAAKNAKRLLEVQSALELIDAENAESRAVSLLKNLGFSAELLGRSMSALSGGWQVRTALAAAIFSRPDLLLLDEPTNHLSIGAVLWLARELRTSETWQQRIVVIVSHDRVFLDEVSTDTLHVSGAARKLTQSRGNYSAWAKRRQQQQITHNRELESKNREIKELRDFNPATLGSTPKAMKIFKMKVKQAEKLEEEASKLVTEAASLQEDAELPLALKSGGELSGFAVNIRDVGFRYAPDSPTLFRGAELGVDSKSRIVLLGENGNGKTTLVKLLLGELEPSEGEIFRAGGARLALVNQHHAAQIDLTLSPLQYMIEKFPGDGSYVHEQALRSHLAGCGVTSEMMALPASALSGGQRSRVALAAVSYTKPHVLVLDEPTNNLDLESVVALADCIDSFEGGVVLVSHDQYFVSRVAKEVWLVEHGKVQKAASFEAYRAAQLAKLQ